MTDKRPLVLEDLGGGQGRMREMAAGERVPSDAVPLKLQAMTDLAWTSNKGVYLTGPDSVATFDLPSASRDRISAGLGTAANGTVNSSTLDVTPGRLAVVGTAGFGGTLVSAGADLNAPTLAETSALAATTAAANTPSPSTNYNVLHLQRNTTFATQLAFALTTDDFHARRRTTTTPTWSSWVRFWHSGNLTPNVLASYTLATLPSAAANPRLQAWCSNLTGGAMPVYSDGTNWRRVFDNSIAN